MAVDRDAMPPDLVARGEQLAAVRNCGVCHTPEGGEPYAGGYAMDTPFGVVYSTNITPDPETGIGTWSEAAFVRSMREGVDREGRHLYPAFPYHFFVRTSDDDLRAIYAYIIAQDPVRAEARENELLFPLGFRPLIAGWKLLFHREGRFEPLANESDSWNRGAYLVEGQNRVTLSEERDALGLPRPAVSYRIEDYVRRSAEHTREAYARISELLGGTEVEFNDEFAGNNHIMGTTIMGADPRNSVVDADCRTHQHPNLYIAGSSVFTTGGSINSTLTLAALALRLAHHLADSPA